MADFPGRFTFQWLRNFFLCYEKLKHLDPELLASGHYYSDRLACFVWAVPHRDAAALDLVVDQNAQKTTASGLTDNLDFQVASCIVPANHSIGDRLQKLASNLESGHAT
jgi:hypothetical protein